MPVAVGALTLLVYAWRLDYSPIHLHYDEIFFGLQGQAIQSTGRDVQGRLLPLYFQLDATMNWYQPAAVYWTALVLSAVPLSDWAIRLPTVLLGVANVVLIYFVAWRVFRSTRWALLTAAMLMLTPAHFIHSRLAMDYLYPLPFLLGWLLGLLTYLERPSGRLLFVTTSCLGLGFFTYIAAVALMPMYLGVTLLVLWFGDRFRTDAGLAMAGFVWPLLALGLFLLRYPEVVPDLSGKYGLAVGGSGLDPMQRLREAVNSRTVSDTLNFFHRYFSPGYMFVTGGSNLTNSTRESGVFLVSCGVFLAAGLRHVLVNPTRTGAILFAGFVTAPIPALVIPEDYAVDRVLAIVPFTVLLAAIGAQRIWLAPLRQSPRTICGAAAGALALVGVGYGIFSGRLSVSTLLVLAAAGALLVTGVAMERARSWRPVVAALLIVGLLQFVQFSQDYFDGYRLRSAGWFGGNIRGAVEELIRLAAAGQAPELHLSTDIPYIRSYWRFYLDVNERQDLESRTRIFDGNTIAIDRIPPNSLLLAAGNDPVILSLAKQGRIRLVGTATDPSDGGGDLPQFAIYAR